MEKQRASITYEHIQAKSADSKIRRLGNIDVGVHLIRNPPDIYKIFDNQKSDIFVPRLHFQSGRDHCSE